ncbi:MAG: hypothetical protein N2D54_00820, partial [Chloroflexota bacterium]
MVIKKAKIKTIIGIILMIGIALTACSQKPNPDLTNQPENRPTAPTTQALSITPTETPVLATESPTLAILLANPQA